MSRKALALSSAPKPSDRFRPDRAVRFAFNQVEPADVIKGKSDSIINVVMDKTGALLAIGLAVDVSA